MAEERANAERANTARLEAERRCQAAEKERDVYRILARRWKTRLQASSGGASDDTETIEEAAAAMLLGSRESVSLLGLGNMFRRFRARASAAARREESDDDPDDDDEEEEEEVAVDASDRMEEDNEDDDMSEDSEEEDSSSDEDVDSFSVASELSTRDESTIDISESGGKKMRPQPRTVSLSEDDF